jgi:hypothetical protein
MKRLAALMLVGVIAGTVAGVPVQAAADARHSGRVLEIDPRARTMRIEEMKAWAGPGTGTVELALRLASDAQILSVRREPGASLAGWLNAWREEAIDLDAVRPGDFVTVTTGGKGDVASLQLVRPES